MLRRLAALAAISSTAARNAGSLAFDGLLKPLTFLTNCNDAERISSSVTAVVVEEVLRQPFLRTFLYMEIILARSMKRYQVPAFVADGSQFASSCDIERYLSLGILVRNAGKRA